MSKNKGAETREQGSIERQARREGRNGARRLGGPGHRVTNVEGRGRRDVGRRGTGKWVT